VSLATELTAQGHDAEVVSGENGQFDVVADGTLVFSKKAEGRFPEHDEIFAKLDG
jgi:selT/selW/selH-like putative selenoprotein